MKRASIPRRIVAAAAVTVILLFLVRPGASRLKTRIINSISRAVGRPADLGSVHVRFLPTPGFDLENLVIYEDPAFGAEPMLRAPEVTAVVRLTSLLRGKLEVSRLELTEPSLNLVRRQDGQWNWSSLLERSAKTPLAPTAKAKSEARPGFPYIEASSGRINFKAGAEKKPYALLNADFAVWQESENQWGVRLKAEPLRADMNLSDTGLLQMSGTWQRAGSLRETPIEFEMEWQRAQLGQVSKLISGSDKGWRGELRIEARLSGTPNSIQMTADASVQDFHRYDISLGDSLDLAAHCGGTYSTVEGVMRELFCTAPVGAGMITLHGEAGRPGMHRADLTLNVENLPANSLAQLARRAKKDLPADLVASGNLQGNFACKEDGSPGAARHLTGHGEFTNLRLQSAGSRTELAVPTVPFALRSDPSSDWARLEYGPFPVALGRTSAAQVRGWVGLSGYQLSLRGDGEVSRALRLANLLGLPAVKANVEGAALLDLQIAGAWAENARETPAGFSLPPMMGTAQLHNVRAALAGLNGTIEITSAKLRLTADKARVEDLNLQAGGAAWKGWVELPRGCGTPAACEAHFSLSGADVALNQLHDLVSAPPNLRRWYQVLATEEPRPSILRKLKASGKLSVASLRIRDVPAQRVSASIEIDHGKLSVSDLRASLLGGTHAGEWQMQFTDAGPLYAGSGTLTGISMRQVADAMGDAWVSGTAAASYRIKASGADSGSFWPSASGEIRFDLRDALLSHIPLGSDDGPLRVRRWHGRATLGDGKFAVEKSELSSPAGFYEMRGTASFTRALDLQLISSAIDKPADAAPLTYSITGTLGQPQVTLTPPASADTQARLKP